MKSRSMTGGDDPCSRATLGVAYTASSFAEEAGRLAKRLGLPLYEPQSGATHFDLLLAVGPKGLVLTPTHPSLGSGIQADFVRGSSVFRRALSTPGKQPLARALGPRLGNPRVIDATAGLGRDTFQLASLGCEVVAVERSPVLAAMLSDALTRAESSGDTKVKRIVKRIQVLNADAKQTLAGWKRTNRPELVYLDPMYTPRTASALSKKEMRILRLLVGGDEDALDLLNIARRVATKRIIVKRHLRADPIADGVVHAHVGRAVRYDVYLPSID